jgi:hypothetical protein
MAHPINVWWQIIYGDKCLVADNLTDENFSLDNLTGEKLWKILMIGR